MPNRTSEEFNRLAVEFLKGSQLSARYEEVTEAVENAVAVRFLRIFFPTFIDMNPAPLNVLPPKSVDEALASASISRRLGQVLAVPSPCADECPAGATGNKPIDLK